MKPVIRLVAVAVCLAVLPACNVINPKQKTLTDDQVVRYIKAYKNLRQVAPHMANELQKRPEAKADPGTAGFLVIEKAVKDAGFKDYPEFVRTNAAIAWAFSQAQGKAFMGEMSDEHKKAYAEIDAKLQDPQVPAAVKQQFKMAKAQIEDNYKKNEGWANVAMNVTSNLTDKESIAVVTRHRKELEAAFTAR
jgi:hypothetical protein